MSRSAPCVSAFVVSSLTVIFSFLIATTPSVSAQAAPRPLRASEVMALEAGGAMQENLAHDIKERGLNFHADANFLALMTKAGADGRVLAALNDAKVDLSEAAKPDQELLQQLSDAGALLKAKNYAEAGAKLSSALDSS